LNILPQKLKLLLKLLELEEEEIIGDLNDYAMRRVASGVPPQARGIYKEEVDLEVAV